MVTSWHRNFPRNWAFVIGIQRSSANAKKIMVWEQSTSHLPPQPLPTSHLSPPPPPPPPPPPTHTHTHTHTHTPPPTPPDASPHSPTPPVSFYRHSKIMYVLSWRPVSALTRVLFGYLFHSLLRYSGNKHQNNPLVSIEIVRHSSTYIIIYSFDNHVRLRISYHNLISIC